MSDDTGILRDCPVYARVPLPPSHFNNSVHRLCVMDFIELIDKLLFLKSNLRSGCDLEIEISHAIIVRLVIGDKTRVIESTKLNAISCECTEIHNRVKSRLKPYLDNVLPL